MSSFRPYLTYGQGLLASESDPHEAHRNFDGWIAKVSEELAERFPGTSLQAEWLGLPYSHLILEGRYLKDPKAWIQFREVVGERIRWLGDLLKTTQLAATAPRSNNALSKRVFVVHGHNEVMKLAVARLLEKLKLEPIILHEQESRGLTIIEKIERYSDVGFAVVLMTADDVGAAKAKSPDGLQARSRQNVILELGYFVALLGRSCVCALYESGVEVPSDFDGVVYTLIDPAESWKLSLAKEIRAAGLSVDLNDL
jgi:predicted nucleotide-binding protein